jgi:hypothetical protein
METLNCMRLDERMEAAAPVAPEPLLGTWLNTNSTTRGIIKAVLTAEDGEIMLQIFAAGVPDVRDWGKTGADIFAADPASTAAMAFSAFYDFGFMETRLQGHVRQGVLIIAKFDRFKDDSGRPNYFSKEFFYRTDQ